LLARSDKLDAAQRRQVELTRASALVGLGDRERAAEAYDDLARRHPRDAEIQIARGEFLAGQGASASELERALDQWRRIASRTRPRTEGWYQAKYRVAQTQVALGDRAGAGKLIRYLQATEDLAAAGWDERFQQLLDRCTR
jgi:hypothetical protein